jgi:hypothetical protein
MSIILPKKDNKYYVFTAGMSDSSYDEWQKPGSTFENFGFDVLTYHEVDMDGNNGSGKILSKNNILLRNTHISHNMMQAARHANGRDWWLAKPSKGADSLYLFLCTPDTVYLYSRLAMNANKIKFAIDGQSMFSPDGSYFAFCNENWEGEVHLYKFDRCSGLLGEYKKIIIPLDSSINKDDWASGVSFSPNNRFLYANTNYYVYQIDLENNYEQIKVGELTTPFPKFDGSSLAYDGRIYVGNENGVQSKISYIEFPDQKGVACNFVPLGLDQKYNNSTGIPNMPHYGLGVLKGSPCDTIRTAPQELVLYPNPTNGLVKIKIPTNLQRWQQYATINVYNMQGQRVLQERPLLNTNYELELNMNSLPAAVYTVELNSDVLLGGVRRVWKVVVL